MKKLISGNKMLDCVPAECNVTGRGPIVQLKNHLVLDDGNCFESPTLVLGNVGTGKTSFLLEVADEVFSFAEKSHDNVVCFCAKPEMLRYARPGDIVISTTSTDPKSCWNIFEELNAAKDPELTLREISMELFSDAEEKTMQPFFPQAARDIFFKTCKYMFDYSRFVDENAHYSNSDLVEFLERPIYGTDELYGWIELEKLEPKYFGMLRDYLGEASEQGFACIAELRTLISRVFYGSFASDSGTFSAIKALKGGGARIFLYLNYGDSANGTLQIFKILLDLLLKASMQSDMTHKTWFMLDEGSQLKSQVLVDALSLGRDPTGNGKAGIRVLMALQSAKLMTRHYTQQEAEVLLSLFPNVISFRVSDSFSRAIIADRYGKALYNYTYANNTTDGDHCIMEDVISDYEFSKVIEKGQAIMSIPGVSEHPFFYNGYQKREENENS